MTDNSPEIANILARYEVIDEPGLPNALGPTEPPKKKRRSKKS